MGEDKLAALHLTELKITFALPRRENKICAKI